MAQTRRLALVHDWLTTRGGAERVLDSLLGMYPQAPVHTLVYAPEVFRGTRLAARQVRPSFLQRLPGSKAGYRWYLPLMPLAIEQFDLGGHEVIVSLSDAVAHGVLARPDQLHISYTFTPMRYVWPLYHEYLGPAGLGGGVRGWLFRPLAHYLRLWDLAAAARVDHFVAISEWVRRRVWRAYRREAAVIYPPVEVDRFQPVARRDGYYLTVSRLVPYKRLEVLVEAFSRMDRPLLVAGEGPEARRLKRRAKANVTFLGRVDDTQLPDLYGRARAFVYAAEEDFGITPVEAQAAGCPVIAYGRGGALETVIGGETGIFFGSQSVPAVVEAVEAFEASGRQFHPGRIRANAERFRREVFEQKFSEFVERAWSEWVGNSG